ncbi:MAG: hypothetical protein II557_08650, partial [Clostridia bacterium]|nr:hypothetical protein [Clostridia bacterium]
FGVLQQPRTKKMRKTGLEFSPVGSAGAGSGLSQISLKVFARLFQKAVGCRGNALTRTPQSAEYPRFQKSSSFCFFFSSIKEKKKNGMI